jgi:hypothetical protein
VFERVKRQAAFLESGAIGYQCADGVGESAHRGTGCNCVHALTDVDPECDRACYPLRRYGHSGSINAVRGFAERGAFLDPEVKHEWLNALLGVDGYPIECRPFPGPGRSRPIWDWLRGCKRMLSGARDE